MFTAMEEYRIKLDMKEVKSDLVQAITDCSQRCLKHSTKWYVIRFRYNYLG